MSSVFLTLVRALSARRGKLYRVLWYEVSFVVTKSAWYVYQVARTAQRDLFLRKKNPSLLFARHYTGLGGDVFDGRASRRWIFFGPAVATAGTFLLRQRPVRSFRWARRLAAK